MLGGNPMDAGRMVCVQSDVRRARLACPSWALIVERKARALSWLIDCWGDILKAMMAYIETGRLDFWWWDNWRTPRIEWDERHVCFCTWGLRAFKAHPNRGTWLLNNHISMLWVLIEESGGLLPIPSGSQCSSPFQKALFWMRMCSRTDCVIQQKLYPGTWQTNSHDKLPKKVMQRLSQNTKEPILTPCCMLLSLAIRYLIAAFNPALSLQWLDA